MRKKLIYLTLTCFLGAVVIPSCAPTKVKCPAYGSNYSKPKMNTKAIDKRRSSRASSRLY